MLREIQAASTIIQKGSTITDTRILDMQKRITEYLFLLKGREMPNIEIIHDKFRSLICEISNQLKEEEEIKKESKEAIGIIKSTTQLIRSIK